MERGHLGRREFVALIGGAAGASPLAARAQSTAKPVIGFLSIRSAADSARLVAAFATGLEEAGFSNGKDVLVDYQFAEGRLERLPSLAAELVRKPVAVLVTAGGSNSAVVAKAATSTIPIVFVIGGDPVALGLATSLSRPGGNATGMTMITGDLASKRLGLLRQLVPKATTFAALTNPSTPEGQAQAADMRAAAQALGLRLHLLEASDESGIDNAFDALVRHKVDAFLLGSDPVFDVHRDRIISLVAAAGVPAIYQFRDFAIAGGLMSYDPDISDAYRQAGRYAGRVLKGAKPADLPIQQPAKFQFVINLKTAKTLGLDVPQTLLAHADEVID
ncbi:MAG: ABC transporter substrate-binding protein [Reyranella sp.]|nr:ABC transporter substrate-binding protein [Reyranella sp.]